MKEFCLFSDVISICRELNELIVFDREIQSRDERFVHVKVYIRCGNNFFRSPEEQQIDRFSRLDNR